MTYINTASQVAQLVSVIVIHQHARVFLFVVAANQEEIAPLSIS